LWDTGLCKQSGSNPGGAHQLIKEGKMEGMIYFGLGIVDKNGISFDPCGMNVHPGEAGMLALVEYLNHDKAFADGAPFRAVELFYKEQQ
jgi:hypothetical protein